MTEQARDTVALIRDQIAKHPVLLYMKGTPQFPQCGFSSRVVEILDRHNVTYHAVNVLADQEIREGIKVFGQWPTIPQLYVNGELIGGCDIITALDEQGELAKQLS